MNEELFEELGAKEYPLLALNGIVVFPEMSVTFDVERETSMAALDASVFDKNMFTMLGCWTGAKGNGDRGELALINAKRYIQDTYIPSWINASNEPHDDSGYFSTEARGLHRKLDEIGVPNDMVFFPGANLPHGYMDQLDSEPHAKEAFQRMMTFLRKHIDA